MIELPEAAVIAGQIHRTLAGRRIAAGDCGTAAHKWAFTNRPVDEYAAILGGCAITGARASGGAIVVDLEKPGRGSSRRTWHLALGGGGERILYHGDVGQLPPKRHLTLTFEDGTALSMAVQGWGARYLLTPEELAAHGWVGRTDPTPLDRGFTQKHVAGLFARLEAGAKLHLKKLLITEPGVPGLGNGYLQDILFHARIHPRRRAVEVTARERQALHGAMKRVLRDAVKAVGNTSKAVRERLGQ